MLRDDLSIAGVDGCRGGWVVVHAGGVEVVDTFAPLLERFAVVGVDMPVGLPSDPFRAADREARAFLGHRRSTIFDVPTRALLAQGSHAAANALSRRLYGRGLSVQSFHLFPKIREIDALDDDALRHRVIEIHPECAFARMAGAPLPPKRTDEGRRARIALVRALVGIETDGLRPRHADLHDVLDACAVLWSVRRHTAGEAAVFGDGACDERGIPMRIVS